MNSTLFITLLFDGLILSGIYAMTALGFVIIYRATGVFNFAQGELMMCGAYLFYLFTSSMNVPTVLAAVLTVLGLGLVAGGLYWAVMRRMTAHPLFAAIIITMGMAIVLRAAVGLIWGPSSHFPQAYWAGQFISIGGYQLAAFDLVCLLIVVGAYACVLAFLRFSPLGLQMRASAENPTLASQRGVNLNKVFFVSWALAGGSAAIAGAVISSRTSVNLDIAHLGISAFPAALVGGLNSVGGAFVGALIVGLVQTWAAWHWGSESQDVVAAGILLLVLMVRPSGLFGTRHVNRL
jgi:branched-chain amino acid transport system permease protein